MGLYWPGATADRIDLGTGSWNLGPLLVKHCLSGDFGLGIAIAGGREYSPGPGLATVLLYISDRPVFDSKLALCRFLVALSCIIKSVSIFGFAESYWSNVDGVL
jgi:hypothetical protein